MGQGIDLRVSRDCARVAGGDDRQSHGSRMLEGSWTPGFVGDLSWISKPSWVTSVMVEMLSVER